MSGDAKQSRLRDLVRTVERTPAVLNVKRSARVLRQGIPFTWRRLSNHWRALPDVVIVGAQKAGTTQLFATMDRHPVCFGSINKEVGYFTKQKDKPLGWYRAHFPLKSTVQEAQGISFEATPGYLPSPEAHERLYRAVPNAKIIVLLRDPVARAYSHYQHFKVRWREERSFGQAVEDIIESQNAWFAQQWLASDNPEPLDDYVSRGYYALQLESLWSHFSRSQTLVMDSSELFADTNAAAQKVYDFIGVQHHYVIQKKVVNRGHYTDKIDPAVADLLRSHYRAHDQRLAELLGYPLSWMDNQSYRLRVA